MGFFKIFKQELIRQKNAADEMRGANQDFLRDAKTLAPNAFYNERREEIALETGHISSPLVIVPYKKILSHRVVSLDEHVTQGGLGRAMLFGGAMGTTGALVGAATGPKTTKGVNLSTRIKIVTTDAQVLYINISEKRMFKNTKDYRKLTMQADRVCAILDVIELTAKKKVE